jgi:hypothetical protein
MPWSGSPDRHDLERVHHRRRPRDGLGGGGPEAGEPVHGDGLDAGSERRSLGGEPVGEHLLGAALHRVQRPGRAGAVTDRGEVDEHGDEPRTASLTACHDAPSDAATRAIETRSMTTASNAHNTACVVSFDRGAAAELVS